MPPEDKPQTPEAKHYDEMYDQHGHGLTPEEHGLVYSMAWGYGHSSGLDEVSQYYPDLADFARGLLKRN